ncbi:MAG: polysaccharide lyase family 7 protein, partial [Myxococcota bacterium]
VMLFSACASTDVGPPLDIITNPGFESGLFAWTVGPDESMASVSDVANEGRQSVRLTGASTFISQSVAVQRQAIYQLTASIRGAGSLGVKVGADIYFEQASASGWRNVIVTFETKTSTSVSIFGSSAAETVNLDGFRLSEVVGDDAELSPRLRSSSGGGFGLSPDLPPGRNFELIDWYLNTPQDDNGDDRSDRFSEAELAAGFTEPRYFYTADDGGMVFRCTVAGARTSNNTRYTRTELREMLRRGDTSIRTRTDNGSPNKNNWVFSSTPLSTQQAAGGVDGKLRATLAVNHVTTTGDRQQVGRVIVGQIHAKDDEPARLYYRKLPEHELGSIYVAHEISGGEDIYFDLIGSRSSSGLQPANGIALNEKFTYEIEAIGHQLTIRIFQQDIKRAERVIDMTNSGYDVADDYMYFKAGVYNQNDSGDPEDYVQATFYELENSHQPSP